MYEDKEERKVLMSMFKHVYCELNNRYDLPQMILNQFNFQVWPVEKIDNVCKYLLKNTTGAPLNRVLQTTLRFHKDVGKVNYCNPPDLNWRYLMCNFLGNIQTSNASNFDNLTPFSQQLQRSCSETFDSRYTAEFVKEHHRQVSMRYGDNTPDVTKVLSVQGTHDPWRSNSILDDLNDETPVVYVQGANHCLELGEEQDEESPQVLQSKYEILEQLSEWIR
ncbi:hypothetical protein ILUMI_18709 [Ignelater luminosus]|uniref:Uncharacterized protein n=1 Tax=Ignelater luminosus TaxID=2038154 RepID=A0A8K0CJE6_IGNLU|nr:hypothetical protein ILUMI_18709 [Ignelater luminosus]